MSFRLLCRMVSFAIVMTAIVCTAARVPSGAHACYADPERMASATREVRDLFTGGDSARLAAQGLPTGAVKVWPVADRATCAAVLGAYNARYPAADSAKRLPVAPILEAAGSDRSVYVLIDDRGGPGYIVFSQHREWLAGIISLR